MTAEAADYRWATAPRGYYDPTTGQFTTPDPLDPITRERYGYAGNDPINGSDPSGLCGPFGNGACTPGGIAHDVTHDAGSALNVVATGTTAGMANCVRYVTCSSSTESVADNHPVLRDTLYITAGAAATVASGGLALDAIGVIDLGTGTWALAAEGAASVAAGGTAVFGDYGRCIHGGDQLACAGMASGGIAALIGLPALISGWGALGVAGLPFALGGLGIDEYGLYKEAYDRLTAGCS